VSTTLGFVLTTAEQGFLYHFNRETSTAEPGPAVSWMVQHDLPGGAMTAFQYWAERNDDAFIARTLFDPLPPFQIPWSSREEFVSRVHEIMAIYPELSTWRFAQP
jgi:hypothetical protein